MTACGGGVYSPLAPTMTSARPRTETKRREPDSASNGDEHRRPVPFVSPASDLLTVIGRDGCFKRVAPTFPPAFGYVEAELLDQPFLTFVHPDDVAATSAALDKLAQGEPTIGLENRFRGKNASYR